MPPWPLTGRSSSPSEVWLVSLKEGVLETYREPKGGLYRSVHLHTPEEGVSPLAFPEASLPWSP